jgi:hypothetical protein
MTPCCCARWRVCLAHMTKDGRHCATNRCNAMWAPPPPTPPLPCLPSDRVCFPPGPAAGVIWSRVCMCEELWSPFCMAGHVCRCCVEYVPGTERLLLGTWPGLVNDLCLCQHTHTYTVSPHRCPSLHFNPAILVCAAALSCCITKHPDERNLATVTPRPPFLAQTQPQLHIATHFSRFGV